MLFNSFEFIVFFLCISLAYFALPFRFRWMLLLVGSYFFYMCWRWEYVFLIAGETLINYLCGLAIDRSSTPKLRRLFLVVGVTASLGILGFFKYADLVGESLWQLVAVFGDRGPYSLLHIALPVGISFFTLQAVGYTIDVYRGHLRAEYHLGKFALYISFFPQLLAGPIARASHLLEQFDRQNRFEVDRTMAGAKLMLWGLFKKAVIADRLAVYVSQIYASPEDYSGATLALATYCYAFQIYCDFSAYSDIAIGAAKVLGYDLMQNFRLPYFATTIPEFWARWHISLSTWFRDYLYIPLGGNRCSSSRFCFNILVVFLVSGLWHGAHWTFVIWGLLHGLYYLVYRVLEKPVGRIVSYLRVPEWVAAAIGMVVTFHMVCFAWVFFRADSVRQAIYICRSIVELLPGRLYLGSSSVSTAIGIGFILVLLCVQAFQARGSVPLYFSQSQWPIAARWGAYLALVFSILLFGVSGNEFIYFQF
jgi:alginate O-acetyltransferase complex protein AlgI